VRISLFLKPAFKKGTILRSRFVEMLNVQRTLMKKIIKISHFSLGISKKSWPIKICMNILAKK